MSLLDHLPTPASYTLRFYVEFYDRNGIKHLLSIYKRDYNSINEPLVLNGDGISVQRQFLDDNFFLPIGGTQISLSLVSETATQYWEFAEANNNDYYVELTRGNIVEAFGYLLPETYEHDWGNLPHIVNITATDNLGFLKDQKFEIDEDTPITGVEKLSDIITFILNKCYLQSSANWWDLIPIIPDPFPGGTVYEWGFLYNEAVECEQFIGMTCAEVLEKILSSIPARIIQCKNGYIIQSPDEQSTTKGRRYNQDGTLEDLFDTFDSTYEINGTQPNGKYSGRPLISVEKSVKSFSLKYLKNYKDELAFTLGQINLPNHPPTPINQETIDDEKFIYWDSDKGFAVNLTHYLGLAFVQGCKVQVSFEIIAYSTKEDNWWIGSRPPQPFQLRYSVMLANDVTNPNDPEEPNVSAVDIEEYNEWTSFSYNFTPFYDTTSITVDINFGHYIRTETNTSCLPEELAKLFIKIKNLKVKVIQNEDPEFEIKKEHIIKYYGNPLNNKVVEIDKYFGFTSNISNPIISGDTAEEFWKVQNVLLTIIDGDSEGSFVYERTRLRFKDYLGNYVNWENYFASKYSWFFLENKFRATFDLVNINGYIYPNTKVYFTQISSNPVFIVSYTWNPKLDYYSMEVIANIKEWILEDGHWNDLGVWMDFKYWVEATDDAWEDSSSS